MNRVIFLSRVNGNGVLNISLPVGTASADQEVRVIVEPTNQGGLSSDEWRDRILSTAGKWQGEFERPPQGEYELREPLS